MGGARGLGCWPAWTALVAPWACSGVEARPGEPSTLDWASEEELLLDAL